MIHRAISLGFLASCISSLAVAITAAEASDKIARVAVIDSGIDPRDPRFSHLICKGHVPWDFVKNAPLTEDQEGHGTHVAGLIKTYAGSARFCFLFYRFYSANLPGTANLANEVSAIRKASSEGATLVNISGGGEVFDEQEYLAIRDAQNIRFVLAAGNEGKDVERQAYYPASYSLPNITAVGALDHSCRVRLRYSNYGRKVKAWERGENQYSTLPNGRKGYMSGTSQATAVHTGKVLAGKEGEPCSPVQR